MVREVGLVAYLPPFMAEYKETNATLTAEDPEFALVWQAADRVLKNEFIATADDYGLSRFERMLGILPADGEPLECRRQAVLLRWAARLPYTLRRLRECLTAALGDDGYLLHVRCQEYLIDVTLMNKADSTYHAIDRMLSAWVPMNMGYRMESRSTADTAARMHVGAAPAEFIRIVANPIKEDAVYRDEAKIAMGAYAFGYCRASYGPKGGA